MYGKAPRKLTPYAEFVNLNVPQAVRVGQGLYTMNELAAMVGLKPTHNFKRRVYALAADGVLTIYPTFTPRGGIENRYGIKEEVQTQEHVF